MITLCPHCLSPLIKNEEINYILLQCGSLHHEFYLQIDKLSNSYWMDFAPTSNQFPAFTISSEKSLLTIVLSAHPNDYREINEIPSSPLFYTKACINAYQQKVFL